ncbi:putative ion channel [Viridothelium virens]|uniref:Putative ion channel n=1 Tax=Viridothelium virens TaxID=1048519 RepID=A0A6A6H3S5_VIRVR|nr:putative ion channel [Viridothelium virens]
MPIQLEEGRESLMRTGEDARRRASHAWDGFIDFAFSDNVLEVAIGLILASAFTAIVTSLTSDIILPIVSLLPFLNKNLDGKFAVLRGGPHAKKNYNTADQALDDGAVILLWGSFVDKIVRFFIIAMSLYLIARIYSWVAKDNIVKRKVKCKYCRKRISEKAKRCINCTSWQDGREDKVQAATG